MPPKKVVEIPKAATGDEAALAKEQLVRDGVNIEVDSIIFQNYHTPLGIC